MSPEALFLPFSLFFIYCNIAYSLENYCDIKKSKKNLKKLEKNGENGSLFIGARLQCFQRISRYTSIFFSPLNKLFGDVVGELFCSDIYSKKWMKNPSMYPIEKYLDLCASDEPCALNPNFVASLSNILSSKSELRLIFIKY